MVILKEVRCPYCFFTFYTHLRTKKFKLCPKCHNKVHIISKNILGTKGEPTLPFDITKLIKTKSKSKSRARAKVKKEQKQK